MPQRTVLWQANENNILAHFVYGLAVTKKRTILAFAEARITESKDDGAHHLVLKRSTDGEDLLRIDFREQQQRPVLDQSYDRRRTAKPGNSSCSTP